MTFSDRQLRQLRGKLDHKRVKTRDHGGREVSYVEGWYVMAEANRIFGFDGWDRSTLSQQVLYERGKGPTFAVAYRAQVRLVVRPEAHEIVREGSGFGSANDKDLGLAHELALKAAETDATKRALATFGNRFGLALYDAARNGGHKSNGSLPHPLNPRPAPAASKNANAEATAAPNELGGEETPARSGEAAKDDDGIQSALVFFKALRSRVLRAADVAELDEIALRSSDELSRLRQAHPDLRDRRGRHFAEVVLSLIELKRQEFERRQSQTPLEAKLAIRVSIDKSRLLHSVLKRHRDKDHLRRVAALPCLVCGRKPSQAHHVRYAQARGMALKVSDEFTVPLCSIDHDALHRSGDERAWWEERRIDPLPHAQRLWQESRGVVVEAAPAVEAKDMAEPNANPTRGPDDPVH